MAHYFCKFSHTKKIIYFCFRGFRNPKLWYWFFVQVNACCGFKRQICVVGDNFAWILWADFAILSPVWSLIMAEGVFHFRQYCFWTNWCYESKEHKILRKTHFKSSKRSSIVRLGRGYVQSVFGSFNKFLSPRRQNGTEFWFWVIKTTCHFTFYSFMSFYKKYVFFLS